MSAPLISSIIKKSILLSLRFYFIFIFSLLGLELTAQDSTRFYSTVDTLCTPYFYGRGYVNNGHMKTAKYLESVFKNADSINSQTFSFPLNVIQKQLLLVLDKDTLSTCYDYIPLPQASKGKGTLNTLFLDSTFFQSKKKIRKFLTKDITKHALVFHSKFESFITDRPRLKNKIYNSASCIIKLTSNDLLKSFSTSASMPPAFSMREELFNSQKKIHFIINQSVEKIRASNIIATVKGTDPSLKELIVCAHYDHVGGYRDCYIPGANDNATGVAMLIELYHHYLVNRPKRTIKFISFAAEEVGLIGSYNYTEQHDLSTTSFVLNLDLYGAGSKGLTVVNGKLFKSYFNLLTSINDNLNLVSRIKARGEAANSDHYYFSKKGIPAFFIYSNGTVGGYHNIKDVPDDLEKGYFNSMLLLLRLFLDAV